MKVAAQTTPHLTSGQRAWLEALLKERQGVLDQRLATHLGGRSRAEHAREVLLSDSDDVSQREAERELDLDQTDRETQELGQVSEALRRLHEDAEFGLCSDCGEAIAFDRLKVEPWALRCVACESVREKQAARGLSG